MKTSIAKKAPPPVESHDFDMEGVSQKEAFSIVFSLLEGLS